MPINNMRPTIFVWMIVFISFQLSAQKKFDPKMMEVIKSKKVAFITAQVGLTPKESEKFWPVYNQMEKERYDMMDRKRELEETTEDKTVRSEEYYRKLTNEIVATHLKEGKIVEEYNAKFLSILPAEKVVKLYLSERKFRSYMMQEMRKKDDDKPEKK
jgi:hypothetical protein